MKFRRYPARASDQHQILDDHVACRHCLGGTCCTSEDPIALTAFDVLRLCAFLDLPPAVFLRLYTQDRFAIDSNAAYRTETLEDPHSSVVTWLRRRANATHSPCLFLKYAPDADGTPRRVCSVHPARPLACREYYHDTCKARWTGELAALQAQGYEAIRDGRLTRAHVEQEGLQARKLLARDPDSAPAQLANAFWHEMRRALDWKACNQDGAALPDLDAWQDPLPAKLERLLSRKHLRLEERYGPLPSGDQLQPYPAATALAPPEERARLLRLATSPPESSLFRPDADYPHQVAHRDWLEPAASPPGFRVLSEPALRHAFANVPAKTLHPRHRHPGVRAITTRDVALALARGVNFLAHTASYARTLGNLLEGAPPGTLEAWLAAGCRVLSATCPEVARHPALREIQAWTATQRRRSIPIGPVLNLLRRERSPRPHPLLRLLQTQQIDGGWGTRPSVADMGLTQTEYVQRVVWGTLIRLVRLGRTLSVATRE